MRLKIVKYKQLTIVYNHAYIVYNILSSFDKFVKLFLSAAFCMQKMLFSVLFETKVIDDFAKDDILYKRQSLRACMFHLVCIYLE